MNSTMKFSLVNSQRYAVGPRWGLVTGKLAWTVRKHPKFARTLSGRQWRFVREIGGQADGVRIIEEIVNPSGRFK